MCVCVRVCVCVYVHVRLRETERDSTCGTINFRSSGRICAYECVCVRSQKARDSDAEKKIDRENNKQ